MKKNMAMICTYLYLFLGTMTVSWASEEITIGYFEWNPLLNIEQGQIKPVGPVIDYYENVFAKQMGVTIKWKGPYPVLRVIHQIKNNELDMIVFLTKNTERAKIMAYPDEPFYIMQPVVCINKNITVDRLRTWNDLIAVADKVGIYYGSALQKKMSQNIRNWNFVS